MSNQDYIPFSNSPISSKNNRGGWHPRNFNHRAPSFQHGHRNNDFSNNYSPYRGNGRKDYIPFSNSPISSKNNRGGWHPRNFNHRAPSFQHGHRNNDFSNNYSPYRGNGRKSFNNMPRNDGAQDISAYYHPSMLEDPWAELEEYRKRKTAHDNMNINSSSLNSSSMEYSEQSVVESEQNLSKSSTLGSDSQQLLM